MIALNARYDGKVLIPDEPLNLPANQKVHIQVEPINSAEPARQSVDLSKLLGAGLAGPTNSNPRFHNDDALWEGSIGDTLINDPRIKPR